LPERLEQLGKEIGCNSSSGVPYADLGTVLEAFQRHQNLTAPRGELDRVGHQVPDDLLEPFRIAGDSYRLFLQEDIESNALGLCAGPTDFSRCRRHRIEVDGTYLQAQFPEDDPRDIQEVINELCLGSCTPFDRR